MNVSVSMEENTGPSLNASDSPSNADLKNEDRRVQPVFVDNSELGGGSMCVEMAVVDEKRTRMREEAGEQEGHQPAPSISDIPTSHSTITLPREQDNRASLMESHWAGFQTQVAKMFDQWFSLPQPPGNLAAKTVPAHSTNCRSVDGRGRGRHTSAAGCSRGYALCNSAKSYPLGFSFSPAGLLLPYHLGVVDCLEHFGMLTAATPLAGASAGALAVACAACDVSPFYAMRVLLRVEEVIRRTGAARKLHSALVSELDQLLPEDAHTRLNSRPGRVTIAYTHVWPFLKGQFVSRFSSCADVKECLIASCNIPFYFSHWPTVSCRGQSSVDGYFASTRTFGCPKTGAERDICVLPFSARTVRIAVLEKNCISPDLQMYDPLLYRLNSADYVRVYQQYINSRPSPFPHSTGLVRDSTKHDPENTQNQDEARVLETGASDAAVQKLAEMWGIRDINAPFAGLVSTSSESPEFASDPSGSTGDTPRLPTLHYSIRMLLKVALDAAPDDVLVHLFDVGRADAYRWLSMEALRASGRNL